MATQIRQLSSQAFQDVEEQAQAFTGWDVSYAQVSPGTYASRIDAVQFAQIRLIRERSDQVVSQAGVGRKGHYVFGLCTTPTPATRFNGRSWAQGIAATRGGREFCVRVDRNDMLMLEIKADTLEARLAISCEDRLDALFNAWRLPLHRFARDTTIHRSGVSMAEHMRPPQPWQKMPRRHRANC